MSEEPSEVSGEGVGQEQPVSLFHSQVFRLGSKADKPVPSLDPW